MRFPNRRRGHGKAQNAVFVYFSNVASNFARREHRAGRKNDSGVRYNLGLMRRLKFSRVLAPYDASL
jgi:hypothetical protein